ncbi:hypothetical protein GCM10009736_79680 [Actinomadura bangladeshensis]
MHGPAGEAAGSQWRLLERVVAPVHQRVAPLAVLDVAGRALGEVAVDVTDHLVHVRVVLVGQVGPLRPQQLDDPAAGRVARRLPGAVLLADRLRFLGLQPALQLLGVMLTA